MNNKNNKKEPIGLLSLFGIIFIVIILVSSLLLLVQHLLEKSQI